MFIPYTEGGHRHGDGYFKGWVFLGCIPNINAAGGETGFDVWVTPPENGYWTPRLSIWRGGGYSILKETFCAVTQETGECGKAFQQAHDFLRVHWWEVINRV